MGVKSGITMNSEVKATWTQLNKRQISGFVFKINDKRDQIIVEPKSILDKKHKSPYTTSLAGLEEDACRYVAIEFGYKDAEGKIIQKAILVMWSPDTAKVRDRMSLASSISEIKRELSVGEGNVFEMHGDEDKSIDTVLRKFASGKSPPVECEEKK